MIELDEGIEALDAAIEYRSDTIHSKQLEVRHSQMLAQVGDYTILRLWHLISSRKWDSSVGLLDSAFMLIYHVFAIFTLKNVHLLDT